MSGLLNWNKFKEEFLRAYPAALVSLTLFFSNQALFGAKNALIAPYMTVLFIRLRNDMFKERNTTKAFFIHILIGVLSFVAGINLWLTVIVNLVVVFLLVYLLTDEYKPTNYFPYVMGFVFLQTINVSIYELGTRLAAISYSFIVVFIALRIFSPKNIHLKIHNIVEKGFENIILQLNLLVNHGYDEVEEKQRELFSINKSLNSVLYESRRRAYFTTVGGKTYFPFVVVFQHMNNITTDFLNNKALFTDKNINYLRNLRTLLNDFILNLKNNKSKDCIEDLINFLSDNELDNKELNLNMIYILNYLISTVENVSNENTHHKKETSKEWKIPKESRPLGRLNDHLRWDSFKLRFALRLSVIMSLSFVITDILDIPKGYWLSMNIYIMILPFYEDSTKKIAARFKGTFIGVMLSFVLFHIFKSDISHIIIVVISTFLMYSRINYGAMSIYITCYSLAISTLSMDNNTVLGLRFIYTFIAACIAIIANKYIFPMKNDTEVINMMNKLIRLDKFMVNELSNSINGKYNGDLIRELLLKSYLSSEKIDIHSKAGTLYRDSQFFDNFLLINNRLVTEIDHVNSLLSIESVRRVNKKEIEEVINNMNYVLQHTQDLINNNVSFDNIALTRINKKGIISDSFYINSHILKCMDTVYDLYSSVADDDMS